MNTLNTFLPSLRNKVFKLLPMREAYDRGELNHLDEYLENLYSNFSGAFECYQELSSMREIIEAYNNVAFLMNHQDIEFPKWRSIVLRSTRLVQAVFTKHEEV